MECKCKNIIQIMNNYAPEFLAEEWDNVGLQLGEPERQVQKILVTLDISDKLADEAVQRDVDLIITHHPLINRPITDIRADRGNGRIIEKLIKNSISVYAAHTNLDAAEKGVNEVLAQLFELTDTEILAPVHEEGYSKIVVFVPEGFESKVINAMAQEGAGWIGRYSHCAFMSQGTGMFKPLEGSNPYIGTTGQVEQVSEHRVETISKSKDVHQVIHAMIEAHPYEEPAYDIYPLGNSGKKYGLGRIGNIKETTSVNEYIQTVKRILGVSSVGFAGNLRDEIKKVALCGGSGADFIEKAAAKGANLYITGDIKYHHAQNAYALGLNIIDAGHYNTERVIIPVLKEYMESQLEKEGFNVEVVWERNPEQILRME